MESRPVEIYPVHDYLRSRLCSLYENDSIFDRFECGWNGDDSYPLNDLSLQGQGFALTGRQWLGLTIT